MRRTPASLRVAVVAWLIAITLLLPALNLTARPLPAYADDETPTPSPTATPNGWGGNNDDDDG